MLVWPATIPAQVGFIILHTMLALFVRAGVRALVRRRRNRFVEYVRVLDDYVPPASFPRFDGRQVRR